MILLSGYCVNDVILLIAFLLIFLFQPEKRSAIDEFALPKKRAKLEGDQKAGTSSKVCSIVWNFSVGEIYM